MSEEISKKEEKPGFEDSWWGKVGFGLFLAFATFYLNSVFTDLETGVQERVRMNVIIALLYNTLGHAPTVLIIGGLAGIFVLWGVYQLATDRKDE